MRHDRLTILAGCLAAVCLLAMTISHVRSAGAHAACPTSTRCSARLTGYEPQLPINTPAAGRATLTIASDGLSATIVVSAEGFQSHVQRITLRFGQPHLSGAPIFHLCAGHGNPTEFDVTGDGFSIPDCPQGVAGGAFTIAITGPAMLVGGNVQGLAPGDFASVLAALRAGTMYLQANTDAYVAGEIRGQLHCEGP